MLKSLLLLLPMLCVAVVNANTEIINFNYPSQFSSLPQSIQPKPTRLIKLNEPTSFSLDLNPNVNQPTQYLIEYTYQLSPGSKRKRLEELQGKLFGMSAKRTVRLSWAATYPMDFQLDLFEIPHSSSRATPQFGGYLLLTASPSSVHSPSSSRFKSVPVTLLIEPVWLGVIPESMFKVIGLLVGIVGVLLVGRVPQRIIGGIGRVASDMEEKDRLKEAKKQ